MPKIAFLIHGWQGTPMHGWRPWLKAELESRGWKVIVPAMPNPDYPKQEEWVGHIRHLVNMLGGPNGHFYFVGHSLGVTAVLRYLETLDKEVGGAVLVAGPTSDIRDIVEESLESFFAEPMQWDKIRERCKKFIIIHSDDDPVISVKHAYVIKEKLNAELIIKRGMGHFSSAEGFTELPAALEAVLKIAE